MGGGSRLLSCSRHSVPIPPRQPSSITTTTRPHRSSRKNNSSSNNSSRHDNSIPTLVYVQQGLYSTLRKPAQLSLGECAGGGVGLELSTGLPPRNANAACPPVADHARIAASTVHPRCIHTLEPPGPLSDGDEARMTHVCDHSAFQGSSFFSPLHRREVRCDSMRYDAMRDSTSSTSSACSSSLLLLQACYPTDPDWPTPPKSRLAEIMI